MRSSFGKRDVRLAAGMQWVQRHVFCIVCKLRIENVSDIIVRTSWNFHYHFSTNPRLARYAEGAAHFLSPFSHTQQPEMAGLFIWQFCCNKPTAVISHQQAHVIPIAGEFQRYSFCTPMPDRIVDGFLTDAQQVMFNHGWQADWLLRKAYRNLNCGRTPRLFSGFLERDGQTAALKNSAS